MTTFFKIKISGSAQKADERLDEIAKKLAADSKIEYPRGTRLKILDARILTEEGRAATQNGVLSLDDVSEPTSTDRVETA